MRRRCLVRGYTLGEHLTLMATIRPGSSTFRQVRHFTVAGSAVAARSRRDSLATEEPLGIRVASGGAEPQPIAVTMRTPGADFDLTAGFLLTEGIIDEQEDLLSIRYCMDQRPDGGQRYNVVNALLRPERVVDLDAERRSFYTTSSCGVCGKASIDRVRVPLEVCHGESITISAATLLALPDRLRATQKVFDRTGGLHAAALARADGEILLVREDVGRHNALDKLIGASLMSGDLPLSGSIVLVSGRLSFELVQKAARAGAPFLAGVSAPSNLAVELAEEVGMTLVGFLRGDRFNVYTGAHRIIGRAKDEVKRCG